MKKKKLQLKKRSLSHSKHSSSLSPSSISSPNHVSLHFNQIDDQNNTINNNNNNNQKISIVNINEIQNNNNNNEKKHNNDNNDNKEGSRWEYQRKGRILPSLKRISFIVRKEKEVENNEIELEDFSVLSKEEELFEDVLKQCQNCAQPAQLFCPSCRLFFCFNHQIDNNNINNNNNNNDNNMNDVGDERKREERRGRCWSLFHSSLSQSQLSLHIPLFFHLNEISQNNNNNNNINIINNSENNDDSNHDERIIFQEENNVESSIEKKIYEEMNCDFINQNENDSSLDNLSNDLSLNSPINSLEDNNTIGGSQLKIIDQKMKTVSFISDFKTEKISPAIEEDVDDKFDRALKIDQKNIYEFEKELDHLSHQTFLDFSDHFERDDGNKRQLQGEEGEEENSFIPFPSPPSSRSHSFSDFSQDKFDFE